MLIRPCVLALTIAGCVDQPVDITPLAGGRPASQLSALGLFAGEPRLQQPAPGVVPYEVIAALWSDGAAKQRFLVAPAPLQAADDHWTIPAGSYLVKTFGFPRDARDPAAGIQLIETRVLAFTADGTRAATYVWNAAQTDATSSGGNLDLPVTWIDATGATRRQVHHVPGTSQCDACHDGDALGIRSPQLADQADAMHAAGLVDRVPAGITPFVDPYGAAALEDRAVSYLDVNCAHCHRPGGEAQGTNADWRRDHVLGNICQAARHSVDGRAIIIEPGAPDASVMLARMRSGDAFIHMPRGPSHVVDQRAVDMLTAWIASLPAGCP